MGVECPKCNAENTSDSEFCKKCATPLFSSKEIPGTETLETPEEELTRGTTLAGRYEIIEELGKGGMGKVYRVEDKKTKEEIALKLIKPEIASDKKTLERFSNELKLAHKISHKNVCRMYHLGEEEGVHFITMEYVPGEDLKSMIRMTRQLTMGTSISIVKQVCDGLAEAHRLGVIHRDLKPSNIMIDKAGTILIMDFGIARSLKTKGITGTGVMIGTPDYMSPEQVEGKEADQRSDIYSLGIILYEILTGRLPFEGDTAFAIGLKHKSEEPEDPRKLNSQIPEDLSRLILKCLEKGKENRYQSVGELRSELIKIEEGIPATERVIPKRKPITAREITVKFSLKKILIPFVALLGLAIMITASVFLIKKILPKKHIPPTHVRLTFTGNAIYPAISPDGKFLGYVTSETFNEKKVIIQDMVSGQSLEVFRAKDCGYLCWTPDSSELSFWAMMEDSSSGTFIIPLLGGKPRRLAAAQFLAWSPDGSRFASCNEDSKEIQITNKTTGESTSIPLKGSFREIDDIDWSPNGNFLLFLAFYESHRSAIWTISIDGSEQHKVDEGDLYAARWSSRGNAIYYIQFKKQESDLLKIPVSPDTGKPMKSPSLIIGEFETLTYFTITSDGKRVLYAPYDSYANLWLAAVEHLGKDQTVKPKQLTVGTFFNIYPSISPDGTLVAFSRGYGVPFHIYVMPIEGGPPQQITFLNSFNFQPVWSSDGSEIAFCSNQGGANKVWKVSARGGKPHQFVESKLGDIAGRLAWAPGPNILYPTQGARNFNILNPDTGEETPLVEEDSVLELYDAQYSPDGKKVAVLWNRPPDYGLWVISLEDSSQVFLRKGTFFPIGWSSDGKWVYSYETKGGTIKIFMIGVENGQKKDVASIPFTFEFGGPTDPCMIPGGRYFVIPAYKTTSDIWMFENFDPEIK
jgi:serine/threonine-protein kinase